MGANSNFKVRVKVLVEREAIVEMSSLVTPTKEEVLEALGGQTGYGSTLINVEYVSSPSEEKIVEVISDPENVEE